MIQTADYVSEITGSHIFILSKSNSAPRCKQRGMFAPVISYSNSNKFICV